MSDRSFTIVFALILLIFVGIGVVLLLSPSRFLRYVNNSLQPDTPINRVYMRVVGIFCCLFVLLPFSGSTKTSEGFHANILIALGVSPVILPIFLWILWRYSSLQHVNRRFLAGEPEDARWEFRMSAAFCLLLFVMIVTAFILGMSGIYPK